MDNDEGDEIIKGSMTVDGKPFNIVDEALYYAKHPEELEQIPEKQMISIELSINKNVAYAFVFLLLALGLYWIIK